MYINEFRSGLPHFLLNVSMLAVDFQLLFMLIEESPDEVNKYGLNPYQMQANTNEQMTAH